MIHEDAQGFEMILRKQLKGYISYYDEKESFYYDLRNLLLQEELQGEREDGVD